MLIDYLVMSGALLGGGSALGLLILNRPEAGKPGGGADHEREGEDRSGLK